MKAMMVSGNDRNDVHHCHWSGEDDDENDNDEANHATTNSGVCVANNLEKSPAAAISAEDDDEEVALKTGSNVLVRENGVVSEHDNGVDYDDVDKKQIDQNGDVCGGVESGSSSSSNGNGVFRVAREGARLFWLALPMIPVQLSMYFIFTEGTAAVGRELGTTELGAFALGSLVGNLTCLSIMEGCLSAADTLMPRAYGRGLYEEVGRLAIRGTVCSAVLLLVPIVPLCLYLEPVLLALGQDAEASRLAQEWIRIYFLGAPANLVFRLLMRFLLAQHKPWPPVWASVVPCLVINPALLKWLVPAMGLAGSSLSIAITQWCMMLWLMVHLFIKPEHHPATWPGMSVRFLKEALRPGPLYEFCHLGLGGMFSLADWWLWEILCFVAGSFGVVSLCVHTIAYQLCPLLFMIPLGLINGYTVLMGNVIADEPRRAKLMATWGMGLNVTLGLFVAVCMYLLRRPVISLFTTDQEVVEGCLRIWYLVCFDVFFLYVFGMNHAIYRVLGIQWRMAVIVFVVLWLALLPATAVFAIWRGGGIYMEWILIPTFYGILQVALIGGFVNVDWVRKGDAIKRRMSDAARDVLVFQEEQAAVAAAASSVATGGAVLATEETPLMP